jgi:hypothetical protein
MMLKRPPSARPGPLPRGENPPNRKLLLFAPELPRQTAFLTLNLTLFCTFNIPVHGEGESFSASSSPDHSRLSWVLSANDPAAAMPGRAVKPSEDVLSGSLPMNREVGRTKKIKIKSKIKSKKSSVLARFRGKKREMRLGGILFMN